MAAQHDPTQKASLTMGVDQDGVACLTDQGRGILTRWPTQNLEHNINRVVPVPMTLAEKLGPQRKKLKQVSTD